MVQTYASINAGQHWRAALTVTPANDGVAVDRLAQGGIGAPITDNLKNKLKQEAEETGEHSSRNAKVRYEHDLDTRDTQFAVASRPSAHEMAEKLQRDARQRQEGELSPQPERLMSQWLKNQEQKQRSASRRRVSRQKEKQLEKAGISEIVIIQDSPTGRF